MITESQISTEEESNIFIVLHDVFNMDELQGGDRGQRRKQIIYGVNVKRLRTVSKAPLYLRERQVAHNLNVT